MLPLFLFSFACPTGAFHVPRQVSRARRSVQGGPRVVGDCGRGREAYHGPKPVRRGRHRPSHHRFAQLL